MTSPLRKKRPTIRWNNRAKSPLAVRSIHQALYCCLAMALCWGGLADVQSAWSREPRAKSKSVVKKTAPTDVDTQADAEADAALDRLKSRSPEEQWERLNQKWKESQQEDPMQKHRPPRLRQLLDPFNHDVPVDENSQRDEAPVRTIQPGATSERQSQSVIHRLPDIPEETPRITLHQPLDPYDETAGTPTHLKRIVDIFPYADYEPDPKVRSQDPCANLCPLPDKNCPQTTDNRQTTTCPQELSFGHGPFPERRFDCIAYSWQASNVNYNPLYFEDPDLERLGHTRNQFIQPFVSVGKFGLQLVGLPYQTVISPVCSRTYPLGWYRPGECAPQLTYPIPWNFEAALFEGAVIGGLVWMIP